MKTPESIKKACQVLRRRVRYDGAGLRLPTTQFPAIDTPAIHARHTKLSNANRKYKKGYSLNLSKEERLSRSYRAIAMQLDKMGRAALAKATRSVTPRGSNSLAHSTNGS